MKTVKLHSMISPELQNKANDVVTKAIIMTGLLKDDQVFQPRLPEAAFFAQEVFFKKFVNPNYTAQNMDYLDEADYRAQKEGRRKRLSPRHGADADHLVWRYILNHEGYQDLADNTTIIAGVNMLKRSGIRVFMRAENVLYIATPDDLRNSHDLLTQGKDMGFGDNYVKAFKSAHTIFRETNEASAKKVEEVDQRGGYLMVYAEGGRPYDGLMKPISRYIAGYYPKARGSNEPADVDNSAVVTPMRMYGSVEFNPPNRVFRMHKILPGFHQQIGMRVGPSYLSGEVWDWMEKHSQNPGDMIGAHIANVDPTDIRLADLMLL